MKYIKEKNWRLLRESFAEAKPFSHIIIDDFFTDEVLEGLLKEYPKSYNDSVWGAHYNNVIESKKTCNYWDAFPPTTYQVFKFLCSQEFEHVVEEISGQDRVIADIGLHGGGWHSHTTSGKLNIHLDYSIHPKLKLERHYNLIVYITPEWQTSWGGGLELWSHDPETKQPKECITTIENCYNRAVLFDTTQNSWHGLPADLNCPEGVMRQSLAIYYLTEPSIQADPRGKALFAPYKDQANDPEVLKIIELRSQVNTANQVYRTRS